MEEKNQEHQDKDRSDKKPASEAGKDATAERVAEEESGGALPSNHSDESCGCI